MIDWEHFGSLLAKGFAQRVVTAGNGGLFGTGEAPLFSHTLLHQCSDDQDEREEIATYEWSPADVLEMLGQHYRAEQWFSFYWDSIGPTSWCSSLWLLRREDRSSIVGLLHEDQPLYLLGIVKSDDDPLLLSRLFTRIVEDNGASFGVQLFGSLPIETTNWLPHLVPEQVVKQAYWDWQEWCEQVEGSAWLNLEETLASYELYANPMERGLAAISSLPNQADSGGLERTPRPAITRPANAEGPLR